MSYPTTRTTAEELDTLAAKVGGALYELEDALVQLHTQVNFGPDLEGELESAFDTLGQVMSLVSIAATLYPYPVK